MNDFLASLPMDTDTFGALVFMAVCGVVIPGVFATLNWINKRIEKTR